MTDKDSRTPLKITYIYHSCFAVELARYVLVFDYYKGKLPKWDGTKSILFFASHKHHDHFDFTVFDYCSQYEKCHYFFSSDIKLSDRYLERNGISPAVKEQITSVGKNKTLTWEDVTIETLRSTDAGVAFIVSVEGRTFYHAGDLNWWHWEGESELWNRQMELDYKRELEHIKGRYFDAAFVPLDPRLENAYDYGMKEFLGCCDAASVFPMHMWEQYDVIDRLKKSGAVSQYAGKLMEIRASGQEFVL